MNCADCGVEVIEIRDGTGHHWAENTGYIQPTLQFYCRKVMDDDVVVSADFHYVEGEEQEHWTGDGSIISVPVEGDTMMSRETGDGPGDSPGPSSFLL